MLESLMIFESGLEIFFALERGLRKSRSNIIVRIFSLFIVPNLLKMSLPICNIPLLQFLSICKSEGFASTDAVRMHLEIRMNVSVWKHTHMINLWMCVHTNGSGVSDLTDLTDLSELFWFESNFWFFS
jgi:hypothetical protein